MKTINGKTRICALLGNPVEHSMSPAMHNALFHKFGLNYRYLCFRVEPSQLKEGVHAIRTLNFLGANVTVPYKQSVIPYLDKLDPIAEKIGAVNTIVNHQGTLTGYNTDWLGFTNSLEEVYSLKNKKVVLVGAGGAARAIIYGLQKRGAKLTILNRTLDKAAKLGQEFDCAYGNLQELPKITADVLVNATIIGMSPFTKTSILEEKNIKHFKVVYDTIYNPLETQLLKFAQKQELICLNGLKMLVYQGGAAFKLWTQQEPDLNLMYQSALASMQT
ncbi:shikimate dehydrogenase [bacterium]|nr:shikimate dehydrogenase [bacterium]